MDEVSACTEKQELLTHLQLTMTIPDIAQVIQLFFKLGLVTNDAPVVTNLLAFL